MSEDPFQAEQGGDLFPELNEARATITRLNDTRALGLRVEALRAAVQASGASWSGMAPHPLEHAKSVLEMAELFQKWLETGE